MQFTTSSARRVAALGAGMVLGLSVMAGSASAAPKPQREASQSIHAGAWTEDNDGNDDTTPNNLSDPADNAHPSGRDRSVEPGGAGNQGKAPSDPDDDGRGPDRSNGGADEPNGAGGADLADQDGNNGCGNDDDFEDDNNGWCGKRSKAPSPVVPTRSEPPAVSAVSVVSAAAVAAGAAGVAPVVPEVGVSPEPMPAPEVPPAPAARVAAQGFGWAMAPEASPTGAAASAGARSAPSGRVLAMSLGDHRLAGASPRSFRPTEVLGVTYERGQLARTGADLRLVALGGVVLVIVGFGMKRTASTA